jgi:hypothetical protein
MVKRVRYLLIEEGSRHEAQVGWEILEVSDPGNFVYQAMNGGADVSKPVKEEVESLTNWTPCFAPPPSCCRSTLLSGMIERQR